MVSVHRSRSRYRDSLKVPFNLRLLAEIAHTGEAVDEIKSIRTG